MKKRIFAALLVLLLLLCACGAEEPWQAAYRRTGQALAAQEDYGVRIVLGQYDSHLPLGTGVLGTGIGAMLKQLDEENEDFALLHELKNTEDIFADLGAQLSCLGNME